jgi:hypothetical protein
MRLSSTLRSVESDADREIWNWEHAGRQRSSLTLFERVNSPIHCSSLWLGVRSVSAIKSVRQYIVVNAYGGVRVGCFCEGWWLLGVRRTCPIELFIFVSGPRTRWLFPSGCCCTWLYRQCPTWHLRVQPALLFQISLPSFWSYWNDEWAYIVNRSRHEHSPCSAICIKRSRGIPM